MNEAMPTSRSFYAAVGCEKLRENNEDEDAYSKQRNI